MLSGIHADGQRELFGTSENDTEEFDHSEDSENGKSMRCHSMLALDLTGSSCRNRKSPQRSASVEEYSPVDGISRLRPQGL